MKIILTLTIFLIVLFVPSIHAQVDANRYANIVQSLNTGSAAYGTGFKGMKVAGNLDRL